MTRQRNVRRRQCERYLRHFELVFGDEPTPSRAAVWRAAGKHPRNERERWWRIVYTIRANRRFQERGGVLRPRELTEQDKAALARAVEALVIDP